MESEEGRRGDLPERAAARFRLGAHEIDPGLDRITGPGGAASIEPRAMDLLVFLAANAGKTVPKERLLDEVWRGAAVVEGVLPKAISALRHALGDDANAPTYILTVPRRGYRLIAAVEPLEAVGAVSPSRPGDPSSSRRASRDGTEPRVPRAGASRWIARALVPAFAAAAILLLWRPWASWAPEGGREPGSEPRANVAAELPPSIQTTLLEARHLWSRRGVEPVRRANELLVEAAKEAPDSAEVQGWLALSFITRGNYLGELRTSLPRAAEAIDAAFRIDPDSAIAHCAAGALAINRDLDPESAERHLRRAVELDPDLVAARQYLAEALSILERHAEALETIEQALRIEPLSPVLQGVRGLVLTRAGRPLAALEAYERVLVLEPNFQWMNRNRAWSLARLGRRPEAAEAYYLEAKGLGETADILADLRRAIDERGLDGYWEWKLRRLEAVRASGRELRPIQWAEALAGVGRSEEALAAIAVAAKAQDGEYFYYFRDSEAFDSLRSDPRFLAFWRRIRDAG